MQAQVAGMLVSAMIASPAGNPGDGNSSDQVAIAAVDGSHDFDFLHGRWRVHNRRLIGRLQGSDAWQTFRASATTQPLAGGIGNLETFQTAHWENFTGLALRLYDPFKRRWAIHWVDNRNGVLEPAVYGRFADGRGVFEGDDVFEGRPIRVRFIWSGIDSGSPRWEQAFSDDGGVTWETNWIMEFSRGA